jgi:hypothetical protein
MRWLIDSTCYEFKMGRHEFKTGCRELKTELAICVGARAGLERQRRPAIRLPAGASRAARIALGTVNMRIPSG